MKLETKSFNDDFYNHDVGIGFRGRHNNKYPKDLRLKRQLKRLLRKQLRSESKILHGGCSHD